MRNHPLIRTLLGLRGNPRACVYTEPLWGIPFSLFSPFMSVYMAALLLTDRQIGLVASVFALFQAATALLSGAVTDKLGRRRTSLIFDLISWSVPCLLWAFSQNFWWFMVAAAFNGINQIVANSWTCLLVEDAEQSALVNIFTLVHICAQLGVIFAPIAAIMVNSMTIIPAMRIIFVFAFLSMTTKFVILFIFCDETAVGKVRMAETKGRSLFHVMSGYGGIVRRIFKSRGLVLSLTLITLFAATNMIMINFFGLYATLNLLIPYHVLAFFPIVRAVIMAIFMFGLQRFLSRFGICRPMLVGVTLYAVSHVALILPFPAYFSVLAYVILEACAYSLVMPRRDSVTTILIDPEERARITGLIMSLSFTITIPLGALAGLMSDMDRRLPFITNMTIFAIAFVVIALNKRFITQKT